MRLRDHLQTGRPLGSDAFVADVEALTKRKLAARPVGRPRKITTDNAQLGFWESKQ